jgi:hypothetical protein
MIPVLAEPTRASRWLVASNREKDCRDGINGHGRLFYFSDVTKCRRAGRKRPQMPRIAGRAAGSASSRQGPEAAGAEND